MNENPTRREIIEQFIPNSPHAKQLGIQVVSLGTDEAVLELPFKPVLATIGDVVHGGAIGALIDTAAAANGVDLRAEAWVARRGGRLSYCEVRVTDPEGTVVAHGIATYRFG